jgi:hypothetical protein
MRTRRNQRAKEELVFPHGTVTRTRSFTRRPAPLPLVWRPDEGARPRRTGPPPRPLPRLVRFGVRSVRTGGEGPQLGPHRPTGGLR